MPATLIGDLVGSRKQTDRRNAQLLLIETLDDVNGRVRAVQPLQVTVGDEFQGVYESVVDAVLASVLVRLRLRTTVDCRFGIGSGGIEVFARTPGVPSQDGPGWWAARDAIDEVKHMAKSKRFQAVRTRYVSAVGEDWEHFVNSFLMCRDSAIAKIGDRGDRYLFGLLVGQTQTEMAEAEGISKSAVSQYVDTNGLAVLAEAHRRPGGSSWNF